MFKIEIQIPKDWYFHKLVMVRRTWSCNIISEYKSSQLKLYIEKKHKSRYVLTYGYLWQLVNSIYTGHKINGFEIEIIIFSSNNGSTCNQLL